MVLAVLKSWEDEQVLGAAAAVVSRLAAVAAPLGKKEKERRLKLADNRKDANNKAM